MMTFFQTRQIPLDCQQQAAYVALLILLCQHKRHQTPLESLQVEVKRKELDLNCQSTDRNSERLAVILQQIREDTTAKWFSLLQKQRRYSEHSQRFCLFFLFQTSYCCNNSEQLWKIMTVVLRREGRNLCRCKQLKNEPLSITRECHNDFQIALCEV